MHRRPLLADPGIQSGQERHLNASSRIRETETGFFFCGTPEEIAKIALFLVSGEASCLNGAVIAADGGITIHGDLSRI